MIDPVLVAAGIAILVGIGGWLAIAAITRGN